MNGYFFIQQAADQIKANTNTNIVLNTFRLPVLKRTYTKKSTDKQQVSHKDRNFQTKINEKEDLKKYKYNRRRNDKINNLSKRLVSNTGRQHF